MLSEPMTRWLGRAPVPVLLLACLMAIGALANWVWTLESAVAVHAERVQANAGRIDRADARFDRFENKLDEIIDAVGSLRVEVAKRDRDKDKKSSRDRDADNPAAALTGRADKGETQ